METNHGDTQHAGSRSPTVAGQPRTFAACLALRALIRQQRAAIVASAKVGAKSPCSVDPSRGRPLGTMHSIGVQGG